MFDNVHARGGGGHSTTKVAFLGGEGLHNELITYNKRMVFGATNFFGKRGSLERELVYTSSVVIIVQT